MLMSSKFESLAPDPFVRVQESIYVLAANDH